jgi:valyl-tRNA synthetase
VLETGLRLLHPMMVFLTEELYQKLPSFQKKAKSICVAEYPCYDEKWVCDNTVQNFENIQAIVQKARSLCQSVNLPNSVKP